jgi:hypothetical protein
MVSPSLTFFSIFFATYVNIGKHATTKFTPYQLQFGRNPKLPPDKPPSHHEFCKPNDYFYHFQKTLHLYHQQARVNQNRTDNSYRAGDRVFERLSVCPFKLSANYSDPYDSYQRTTSHVLDSRSTHPTNLPSTYFTTAYLPPLGVKKRGQK